MGTGALKDPLDIRDHRYEPVAAAGDPVDWEKGFDVEKELNIKIPVKNQDGSGSCVGQGWAYYVAVLNAAEVGFYDEVEVQLLDMLDYNTINMEDRSYYKETRRLEQTLLAEKRRSWNA